jgi:hypothetical protein
VYVGAVRRFADQPLAGTVVWTVEPPEPLADGIGAPRLLGPGDAKLFTLDVRAPGRVGIGLRSDGDVLACALRDGGGRLLATGCQALVQLAPGRYWLEIAAPDDAAPQQLRPVVLGLSGEAAPIPEEYLRDLWKRIGAHP